MKAKNHWEEEFLKTNKSLIVAMECCPLNYQMVVDEYGELIAVPEFRVPPKHYRYFPVDPDIDIRNQMYNHYNIYVWVNHEKPGYGGSWCVAGTNKCYVGPTRYPLSG